MNNSETIFEALRSDHDRQRELSERLLATSGDSPERAELFDQLRAELGAHAAAEERFFYAPLMKADLTQDKARHSVAEHKELDDFIEQLESYDRTAPQWLITARDLDHRLRHHLEEEEREVFQLAGKALSHDDKVTLAASYTGDMARRRAE